MDTSTMQWPEVGQQYHISEKYIVLFAAEMR
jgi:hypothetical protein